MLTTYDRYMREHKRMRMSSVQVKQLEHKLERTDESSERDALTVPGVVVVQVIRKAAVSVIALFSLAFTVGCTAPIVSERCAAPISAKGCYAWYERAVTVQPSQLELQP